MSIMADKESTFKMNFNSIFTGIKKELTCSICLSLFTNPVTLSTCHHTFCLKCLKNLTVVKNSFECPICKKTTHRRCYYSNEKYIRILKLLDILDSFIKTRHFKESKSKKMLTEEKIKKIECFLNDCASYHMCSEVTTENASVTENKCLTDETKNNKKKKEKPKTKQTKVIQDSKKYLGENIKTKQNNVTNIDLSIISDNSSDENEFIADICPTAEKIEIIRKIEDDFLDLIELEINKDQNPVNLKNNKMILNEITIDSNINEITDIQKNKNCSISNEHDKPRKTAWSRIKDTSLQIRKKGKKYKKLKVTDVKQKKAEKKPILLDSFDEYIENKQIEKKNKLGNNSKNSSNKNVLSDILDEKNIIQNEEDDIFLRSTQKLNLDNFENNESLGNLTKRKSNDNKEEIKTKRSKIPQKSDTDVIFNKIVVDAQVHHELNSEGNNLSYKKLANQNSDCQNRIKLCEEQVIVLDSDNDNTETDKYVEIKLSKDESSQKLNLHKIDQKNKETECNKVTHEHNIDTLRDTLNFNLKDICDLKSTMTLQLQQGLRMCDNIISNYSNHLTNSESLFSNSNKTQDNHEINKNTTKANIKIREFNSLPVPDNLSREIIDFYNTAIPNLNNIKEFYRQLEVFSTEISNNSSMLKANQIETNNEDILEKCKNATIQTDELKCPKCIHTINLENDYLNNSNLEREFLNTSNNNLNLQKNVAQKVNNGKVNINLDLNTKINLDESKITYNTNILNSPALSNGNIKSPSSESDIILHNTINKIAKRKFNRIIAPSSSESEISNSKKAKIESFRSNLLYQYDTEICFDSDSSSDNITVQENINKKIESSKENTNEIKQFQNKPPKSQDTTLKYVYSWEKEFNTSNNKNTNIKNADNKVKQLSPNRKYIEFEKETVAYLEHQYKNPIEKQKDSSSDKCDTTINSYEIKNLLADIEPSAFDDDISQITHNCEKNQFSESLFTETDTVNTSSKISATVNSNDIIPTSIFTDSEGGVNQNSINKNNQQSLKTFNKPCDENKSDDLEIVEDSLDSIQDIFEDDIVESTPPKNSTLRKSNSGNFTIIQNEHKESQSETKKNINPTKYQSSIINFLNPKKQSTLKDVQNTSIETIHNNHYSTPTNVKNNAVAIQKSHPVICTSRLAVNENSEIMTLISKFNIRYSKAFNNSVSHLIVRVDNENRVENQTIKYILAVAHGLWIVSYAWFKDSLACNHLLSEECYEVFDSTGKPGPKMSRLLRNEKPLLRNFTFYLAEPFNAATKLELEDAITNLGGEVKNTAKELVKQPQKCCLILADGSTTNDYSEYQLWRRTLQILVVDVQWLGIVIGQYEVTSFRNFVLCCEDDIEDMGYPPHLIVPMENTELSQTQ